MQHSTQSSQASEPRPSASQPAAILNVLAWLLSIVGVVALLIGSPLIVLVPLGILLGGAAPGATFLILSLTLGNDVASLRYDPALYWTSAVLSSLFALVGTVRFLLSALRSSRLPTVTAAAKEALIYILTLHLSFQVGLGSLFAVVEILVDEGASAMQPLVVSLFSIFVFIVSTTFISYFMRSLIPWRQEHPRFSNAVAYTLSILLGLIASAYTFAGEDTFAAAGEIGAKLYQASVAFATVSATLVGSYVAVLEARQRKSKRRE